MNRPFDADAPPITPVAPVAPDPPVRDASTVVLLRDGSAGLDLWLQQRASTLVFAAGMHAFPGGAVDPQDRSPAVGALDGFDPQPHARVWGCSRDLARALVVAAVREAEEEAGVRVSPASLVPWTRWVTPLGPPRRFDARFFVAPMPVGQVAAARSSEVADAAWTGVRAALERHGAGDLPMWPPTVAVLTSLSTFDDVAEVLAAAPRTIEAVLG
jgi:8-oxo-dGTP pyrophosphatase MutT (NUDIX family)